MRVLHACAGAMYGGLEAVVTTLWRVRDLAPGMQPSFASCFEGRLASDLRAAGAAVATYGPARFSRPWTILAARREFRRLLARDRPDVVVCHGAWTYALCGRGARRAGVPLVFWQHDLLAPGSVLGAGARGWLDRGSWFDRVAARTPPDLVIANSRFTAATTPEMFPGVPIEVIHCPVEPPPVDDPEALRREVRRDLDAADGAVVIAMTCRLEAYKGHRMLLDALALLRDVPGWRAWVAGGVQREGDRAYFESLVAAAQASGIADRVRFLGQRSDVPRLLAAADVHCQPNVGPEPFGIAFVEAMYAGLPVVTTALGGALEVVTEEVGVLTPPGDAGTLAAALGGLIADPPRRARLGAAGPAQARALCDPSAQLGRLREVLDLAIESGRGAARATPAEGGRTWHILTGEYPPQAGGVADYTRLVAHGLAGAGREVHVWTAPAGDDGLAEPGLGVTVHRDAGLWSAADLRRLDARLDAFAAPRRLLVQYTPNAWGRRGLNLGFCRWLERRARGGDEVVAMVHEAIYDWRFGDRPRRLVLAAVHRLMLASLLRAARRVLYAAASLEAQIAHHGRGRAAATLVPIPSTVPVVDDPAGVAATRARLAPAGEIVVGHFGTYGETAGEVLERSLVPLMQGRAGRVALLLGRGGRAFAEGLIRRHPELAGRVVATGGRPAEELSRHLQACDLMIQPYVDGVSTRRTSVMASLAHGLPVATNRGHNTEPLWSDEGGVAVAADHAGALVAEAEALLADPAARAALGAAGADLYRRRFAVEKTIEALLQTEAVTA